MPYATMVGNRAIATVAGNLELQRNAPFGPAHGKWICPDCQLPLVWERDATPDSESVTSAYTGSVAFWRAVDEQIAAHQATHKGS